MENAYYQYYFSNSLFSIETNCMNTSYTNLLRPYGKVPSLGPWQVYSIKIFMTCCNKYISITLFLLMVEQPHSYRKHHPRHIDHRAFAYWSNSCLRKHSNLHRVGGLHYCEILLLVFEVLVLIDLTGECKITMKVLANKPFRYESEKFQATRPLDYIYGKITFYYQLINYVCHLNSQKLKSDYLIFCPIG